jgi:sugar/nucleoside kinase (ribokinase family)
LKSLQFARIGSGLVIGMLLQACGTLPRLEAVPPALTERAAISGIPKARYWLDRDLAQFIQDAILDTKREGEALAEAGKSVDPLPPADLLAISGGGDAGAFAAGILAGWSAGGDRSRIPKRARAADRNDRP